MAACYTLVTKNPTWVAVCDKLTAARGYAFGVDLETKIARPSDVGNYLTGLGHPHCGLRRHLHRVARHRRTLPDRHRAFQAIDHATLLRLLRQQ